VKTRPNTTKTELRYVAVSCGNGLILIAPEEEMQVILAAFKQSKPDPPRKRNWYGEEIDEGGRSDR